MGRTRARRAAMLGQLFLRRDRQNPRAFTSVDRVCAGIAVCGVVWCVLCGVNEGGGKGTNSRQQRANFRVQARPVGGRVGAGVGAGGHQKSFARVEAAITAVDWSGVAAPRAVHCVWAWHGMAWHGRVWLGWRPLTHAIPTCIAAYLHQDAAAAAAAAAAEGSAAKPELGSVWLGSVCRVSCVVCRVVSCGRSVVRRYTPAALGELATYPSTCTCPWPCGRETSMTNGGGCNVEHVLLGLSVVAAWRQQFGDSQGGP